MREHSRTRSVVICGLAIALMSVGAFITVPLPGMMPFTLQTMMLFVILLVLGPIESMVAVAGYLLLGACGLPVFSGMTGGIAKFAGPTGGFLVGYLICALLLGGVRILMALSKRAPRSMRGRVALDLVFVVAACIIYFSLGTLWYSLNMGVDLPVAFTFCVLPFVVTEPLKIIAALACVQPVRLALGLAAHAGRSKVDRS